MRLGRQKGLGTTALGFWSVSRQVCVIFVKLLAPENFFFAPRAISRRSSVHISEVTVLATIAQQSETHRKVVTTICLEHCTNWLRVIRRFVWHWFRWNTLACGIDTQARPQPPDPIICVRSIWPINVNEAISITLANFQLESVSVIYFLNDHLSRQAVSLSVGRKYEGGEWGGGGLVRAKIFGRSVSYIKSTVWCLVKFI